jgi:phosphoglycolate phosphatase
LSVWPRAVVFDLDGTLIDSALPISAAINVLLTERKGRPLDPSQVRPWISLGVDALVGNALGSDVRCLAADIAEFRRIYASLQPDPRQVYPGALDALAELNSRSIQVGICTNKPQALTEQIMGGLGLKPLVHTIVGARHSYRPKPHPDLLYLTLERLAVTREDAMYVGDSETDAETAAAAGVPFVLVNFGYATGDRANIDCCARLDSLHHLPSTLEALVWRRGLTA